MARKNNKRQRANNKWSEERDSTPIMPKNQSQREYFDYLNTKQVVIAEGSAGVGKSFVAACFAADSLRKNDIEKIVVARPFVQVGKHSGFKPGTSLEKLYPYVRNILDPIRKRLGTNVYENLLKDGLKGNIEVQEIESIRGRSFDEPSVLILDEAQETTPEEMESIITRIGERCMLIICGDDEQKSNKGKSGLRWFIEFNERHNLSNVGHVKFSEDDCVRSGFVGEVLDGLRKDKIEIK